MKTLFTAIALLVALSAQAQPKDTRGCSQDALRSSGGDGLFYCFAVK